MEAKLYPLIDELMNADVDEVVPLTNKQEEIKEAISVLREEEDTLKKQRKDTAPHIKVSDLPEEQRFNKLKAESKLLLNIIKMIAYRAETVVANLLGANLKNADKEKRMLVKQIIQTAADIIPDITNNTLTIRLHTLSTPHHNIAAAELAKLLTETETVFPGTDIRLIFKTTAPINYER